MKRSELKQIIREELKGYSQYLGQTKGGTPDEFSQILTKIAKGEPPLHSKKKSLKESEEKTYTVEYWYRAGGEKDFDQIKVKATSEKEAIEKAKQQARRNSISSTFTVEKVE